MRKLFIAFSLVLATTQAFAGSWNLRQKDDGGTYWRNSDGREAHVLETHLTGTITDITLPASHFIISPITGIIEKIYGVLHGSITTANESISFFASNATTGAFPAINEVTNGTSKMSMLQGGTAGDMFTFTPNSATANKVSKGGRIGIHTGGSSTPNTGSPAASFTIIINPK